MQRKAISFKGQKIFIGIDVHKKKWHVTVLTEAGYKRTYSQNASARELFDFLDRHFPGGEYHAVYEAGFTGTSTRHDLLSLGIDCIIIHAADVPTTQYESVMKTDKIDSEKLAKALRSRQLHGIFVCPDDGLDDRSLVRARKNIQKDLVSYKLRIRHLLFTNGVEIPGCHLDERGRARWTNAFTEWLKSDVELISGTRQSLDVNIDMMLLLKQSLLDVEKRIKAMAGSGRYRENFELLCSIPGIGWTVAITLLTEVQDFSRFRNERHFASFLGLVPTCHSSGEKTSHGAKTFRGNKALGPMIIEAAWQTVKNDAGMAADFARWCRKTERNKAIVRVARKLSNIILSVIKNKQKYVPYQPYAPQG